MTIFYSAIYKNGEKFTFSEDDQGTNDNHKIDRKNLKMLELYNDSSLLHVLHFESGDILVLRRRTVHNFGTKWNPDWKEGMDEKDKIIGFDEMYAIYIIGTIQETKQSVVAIYPDGHTEHFTQWKNAPMDKPKLLEYEMIVVE